MSELWSSAKVKVLHSNVYGPEFQILAWSFLFFFLQFLVHLDFNDPRLLSLLLLTCNRFQIFAFISLGRVLGIQGNSSV